MRYKKTLLFSGVALIALGGLITETMHSAGVFRSVEPHFNGTCTRIDGVTGAEDITIDPATGVAYVSAMDRRTLAATGEYNGGIYLYTPGSFDQPMKLDVDIDESFHPHGIDLWKSEDGNDRLFVVAHPPAPASAGENAKSPSQIDIFEVDGQRLVHIRTVKPDTPISLNDVTASGPDSFYASIDQGSVTPLGRTLETYGRFARAGVMFGTGDHMTRVLGDLVYANGIQVSDDGNTLYVAETTGKRLSTYNIDSATGGLSLQTEQSINSGLDNIEIDQTGDLWVVGHPKTFDFLAHAGDASKRSPSQIFRVGIANNAVEVTEVYLNDGDPISGASVAAPFGDRFLIGSVFEPFIMDCSL